MADKYNIEAEKDLMSILLTNTTAVVEFSDKVDSDYFYDPFHKKIIKKMKNNLIEGSPNEISTLSNNRKEQSVLQEIKLRQKSKDYFNTFFSILEECLIARSLTKIKSNINTSLEKDIDELRPSDVLNNVRASIEDIGNAKVTSICEGKEIVATVLNEYELNYKDYKDGIFSNRKGIVATPFDGLNKILKKRGLKGGDTIVIAATPSTGKTEIAINIAAYAAFDLNKNVFLSSLEMSKESLLERLILYQSQVPSDVLEEGTRTTEQWQKIIIAATKIKESNLMFEDNLSADIFDIITSIRKANSKNKLDLVVIDYLQLIQYNGNANTRNDELTAISRAIKQEAVRLGIPIIAISQLSRKHLTENREPELQDLRDSGAIEQDADVVIMLYATKTEKLNDKKTKTKGMVKKQREGPTGEFFLVNHKRVQTFMEISEYDYKGKKDKFNTKKTEDDDLPF